MTDYRDVNRANWDERAAAHATSPDYAVDRLVADPRLLSAVVEFERPLLGDVSGLRGVHLQCHIGTDTLSLSRLGATMTGLDFSGASVAQARQIVARTGDAVEFVQSDVYAATDVLGTSGYDLVYTGVGALCWLPDIRRWARTVSQLLRPGGRLFLHEGHPVLWSLADARPDGLLVIEYPYFERPEPTVFDEPGTYVATDAVFANTVGHEWNHGLGEIVTALFESGLQLSGLVEHDRVPWEAIDGQMTELENGDYRLTDRPWRLPHSYTLQAVKTV